MQVQVWFACMRTVVLMISALQRLGSWNCMCLGGSVFLCPELPGQHRAEQPAKSHSPPTDTMGSCSCQLVFSLILARQACLC